MARSSPPLRRIIMAAAIHSVGAFTAFPAPSLLPFSAARHARRLVAGLALHRPAGVLAQQASRAPGLRGGAAGMSCAAGSVAEKNLEGVYWQGLETLQVARSMHEGNRDKVVKHMKLAGAAGMVLVQSGEEQNRAETDAGLLFRQESNFHYLFGVEHPGCFGTISLSDGSSTLFVPRQPEAYTVWMGPPPSLEQVRATYKVDTARYVDELPKFLAESAPPLLHLYSGVNTDSGSKGTPAHFDGIDQYTREEVALHTALYESRVIKSPDEIAVLRFASKVASQGHIEVMKQCRPGMMEYQLEAVFGHHCYMHGGMRSLAYTPIAGAGLNAAVLHYGHAGAPNNREIGDGDMILSDMGAEYYCYASDITCSYPANGKFTPDQRSVYLAVLECLRTVESHMKPGTSYVEMHQLVEKTLAKHLIGMGVLTGDLDEIVAAELPAVFMPHGLGHNLGLDTHDVGGYPLGSIRATRPGLRALRNVRTLKEGMVLTVEPGCYFIPSELDKALANPAQAKFMNAERIAGLRAFGGVRLEDNVVVTRDGHEVLTHVPREIEEVEATMGSAYRS